MNIIFAKLCMKGPRKKSLKIKINLWHFFYKNKKWTCARRDAGLMRLKVVLQERTHLKFKMNLLSNRDHTIKAIIQINVNVIQRYSCRFVVCSRLWRVFNELKIIQHYDKCGHQKVCTWRIATKINFVAFLKFMKGKFWQSVQSKC